MGVWTLGQFAVLLIFVLAYVLFIARYDKKHYTVWGAVIILLLSGLTNGQNAFESINWNVIGIFIGMFVLAELFIYSRIPVKLANFLARRSKKSWIAILMLCFISGFLSIFLENVATVLIIAPIALSIAKELKESPVPYIVGIAISSNLQGVATLIGDPPSIILGGFANMNFNDFFFFEGKPGLFFAVQIGMLVGLIVLYFLFRGNKNPVPEIENVRIKSYFPLHLILIMIVLLAITSFYSFLPELERYSAGLICLLVALIGAVWFVSNKHGKKQHIVRSIDWETTLFLIGIFILVGAMSSNGIITEFGNAIQSIVGGDLLTVYIVLIVIALIFSAFVDNIPFVVTMLPVTQVIANNIGADPYLLYFGLLIGASVGGNITPIGASANIVAMGILQQQGVKPNFWDFVKIGLPFTLLSVFASSLFIWYVFAP